jgi:hypothetical protein
MHRVVRSTLVVLLLAAGFVLVVTPPPAFACSCASGDATARYEQSDVVFVGTVRSVSETNPTSTSQGQPVADAFYVDVDFAVDIAYKGVSEKSISIQTINQESACGFSFATEERYLVYASQGSNGLGTGICQGTVLASQASLPPPGASAAIAPTPSPRNKLPRTGFAGNGEVLATSIFLVGTGCLLLVLGERRRRHVGSHG